VWIDDYREGLNVARSLVPKVPVTVLGQSMGGSIAMGLAMDSRAQFDALLLCTPALNHLHCAFDDEQQQKFSESGSVRTSMSIPLADASYTTLEAYREFMRDDALMLRTCTVRTMASLYALESHYMAAPGVLAGRRVALVLSANDQIVINNRCREAYEHLVGNKGVVVEMPSSAHFIEFSETQEVMWGFIHAFAQSAGFACPP